MSLVGFKAQNHPQQTTKPMVDDRGTTPEVFGPLMERFNFSIDVAASAENTKCKRYYSIENDGLNQSDTKGMGRVVPWAEESVWCNPPYSNIEPWEQGWWQRQVEPYRKRNALSIEFLPGRLRFLAPGALEIKPNERPPFGCCLLIWETR